MRFPADEIHLVRLGEKTRLTIPYEGRCPFKVGSHYVLEREIGISRTEPCLVCKQTGFHKDGRTKCKLCAGHGTRVYYETKAERVEGEERVQVLELVKLPPSAISDDQALEEGWESADEWRDAFYATHGEYRLVWTLKFELTRDFAQFPAQQNGLMEPPQYVSSPTRAIDDAEAPTAEQYREWSHEAEADRRKQREIRRLEERRRSLDDKIDQLRGKAA